MASVQLFFFVYLFVISFIKVSLSPSQLLNSVFGVQSINASTCLTTVIILYFICQVLSIPYLELLASWYWQGNGKFVKYKSFGVSTSCLEVISIFWSTSMYVFCKWKDSSIYVGYQSHEINISKNWRRTSPIGWWDLCGTNQRTISMNEFESVDLTVFLDCKSTVSVTSSSKANWVIVDLFPIVWKEVC